MLRPYFACLVNFRFLLRFARVKLELRRAELILFVFFYKNLDSCVAMNV
jgi:hypothetical protein